MNNTNNPSRTNKSSSFVHQRWGNAYGRVWRFSCARYDTQLLSSNITVGREANIQGNYWIDHPIIVVVRPSCSEENITKLVFCGGIYKSNYSVRIISLSTHICNSKRIAAIYPTIWLWCFSKASITNGELQQRRNPRREIWQSWLVNL